MIIPEGGTRGEGYQANTLKLIIDSTILIFFMIRVKRDLQSKLFVFIFQSNIFINQSFLFTIQIGMNK